MSGSIVHGRAPDEMPCPECEQERASRLLRAEVVNIAWSLVDEHAPGFNRSWRALTPHQTMDVFDRLMAAVTRHAKANHEEEATR